LTNDAVRWGYVPRNVADAVTAPTPQRTEHAVWTAEQARAFIAGVAGERWEAAFILQITCGPRIGEVCGLKWDDVTFDRGAIQIQRSRQRVRRSTVTEGGPTTEVVDGAPKTRKGARLVLLPTLTAEELRRWRVRQLEERLVAGPLWEETGYVFTHHTGTPIEPNDLHRAFDRVVSRLGLPEIRPYDLRHTCATVLLSQNVNPKYVQELLGHRQITVTMDLYSHVLPAMDHEAANTMERVFGAG
jgi:integrase